MSVTWKSHAYYPVARDPALGGRESALDWPPGPPCFRVLWQVIIHANLQTDSVLVSVDWDSGNPLFVTALAFCRSILPGEMRIVTPSRKRPATARTNSWHASDSVTPVLLGRILYTDQPGPARQIKKRKLKGYVSVHTQFSNVCTFHEIFSNVRSQLYT